MIGPRRQGDRACEEFCEAILWQIVSTLNPIAHLARRRRLRTAINLVQLIPRFGSLADFGPGDSYLLQRLRAVRPDLKLQAIETMPSLYPELGLARDFSIVSDRSLDAITAFDVMEHMLDSQIISFFSEVQRTLQPQGLLIVSMRVGHGGGHSSEKLTRKFCRQQYPTNEFIHALLGYPLERRSDRGRSQRAFDLRALRAQLQRTFRLQEVIASRLQLLPWWINSQTFFCLRFDNPLSAGDLRQTRSTTRYCDGCSRNGDFAGGTPSCIIVIDRADEPRASTTETASAASCRDRYGMEPSCER